MHREWEFWEGKVCSSHWRDNRSFYPLQLYLRWTYLPEGSWLLEWISSDNTYLHPEVDFIPYFDSRRRSNLNAGSRAKNFVHTIAPMPRKPLPIVWSAFNVGFAAEGLRASLLCFATFLQSPFWEHVCSERSTSVQLASRSSFARWLADSGWSSCFQASVSLLAHLGMDLNLGLISIML